MTAAAAVVAVQGRPEMALMVQRPRRLVAALVEVVLLEQEVRVVLLMVVLAVTALNTQPQQLL
jgi:hypothetical protein